MGDHRRMSPMSNMKGLLRIRIKRGINLAIRVVNSSDPYVVVRHGKQKLKTRVIKKTTNPEWNEDLTLCIMDPNEPIKLMITTWIKDHSYEQLNVWTDHSYEQLNLVYDHDTFTVDDKMGDTEFHVRPFLEAASMKLKDCPDGTVIKKMKPSRENCIPEETCIVWTKGRLTQDMFLRLRNVERGEIELSLTWIDIPSTSSV